MYGCKYLKMDTMRQVEYCALTGELTNSDPKCDFGYANCPEYQNALKPIEPSPKVQFMQTSIFGAADEKPFKV